MNFGWNNNNVTDGTFKVHELSLPSYLDLVSGGLPENVIVKTPRALPKKWIIKQLYYYT